MPLGRLLHRPQGRTLLLFGQRQEKLSAEVMPWATTSTRPGRLGGVRGCRCDLCIRSYFPVWRGHESADRMRLPNQEAPHARPECSTVRRILR
jgi:hypothetical protein